jgi:MFS family permease
MVMDLGMATSRNTTGYYAGLLSSALMLGKTFSSPLWGHYTDTHGRRQVVLISLSTIAVCSVLFGLAPNYWFAIAMRFLLGLMSPLSIVLKSTAGELPEGQQTDAMLMLGLGYNTGLVLGNGLGGLLANPTWLGLSFFDTYPYLLPNLVTGLITVGTLVLCLLYYKETLKPGMMSDDPFSIQVYFDLLKDCRIRLIVALQCLNAFTQTAINELLPLWCWADLQHGGLNFNPMEIGATLSASVVVMVLIQTWLYRYMTDWKGCVWVCSYSTLSSVPVVLCLSLISLLLDWKYFGLITCILLWYLFNSQVITSLNIIANNVVHARDRGKMNGLSQSLGSACKATAPTIVGSLFAWSLQMNSFPIDFHLTFYFICLTKFMQYALSSFLDKTYEISKDHKLSQPLI